jgi:hypothetical protein
MHLKDGYLDSRAMSVQMTHGSTYIYPDDWECSETPGQVPDFFLFPINWYTISALMHIQFEQVPYLEYMKPPIYQLISDFNQNYQVSN